MVNRSKKIEVGKKVLGMDDVSYQLLLEDLFGKIETEALTELEKSQLLTRFECLGFCINGIANSQVKRTRLLNIKQIKR